MMIKMLKTTDFYAMVKAYRKTLITNDMKKVFCIFLSLIALMGLSACEPETPGNPQKPDPEESSYLTFVSSRESSVALVKVGEPSDISLEYSLDGKSWNPYTIGKAIYLFDEDKLSFRAGETGNECFSKGVNDYYQFEISGEVAAKGNIMSLLDRSCRKNDIPSYAFYSLFCDCKGLTEAPELPATDLAEGCYAGMFGGCTSLMKAPTLPATNLVEGCYDHMFTYCVKLNYVKALFTDEPSESTTDEWLGGVSFTGTFVKSKEATWDVWGASGIPYGWTVESDAGTSDDPQKPNPEEPYYLTFVSTGESTISLIKIGNPDPIILEYSTNGSTWTPYTIGGAITISNGENLMFRAGETGNECFSKGYNDYYQFEISGEVAVKGNIMSLLDRTCARNSVPSFAFYNLFRDCKGLTEAPELPATELIESCYAWMFYGCTSLTKAPVLPATKMAERCYFSMFGGCTSLTTAPELSATKMADECYYSMFEGCTSLIEASVLPATELAWNCYSGMFSGCMSLKSAPLLPATELTESCYALMFSGCEGLTEAPALPATEMKSRCYYNMFNGCTSLAKAPVLPATELAWNCYSGMFSGCMSLKSAPLLPATELTESCYASMFSGCEGLTEAQELPATELAEGCYSDMFEDCTSLTEAPELPATELAEYCYSGMFSGCTSLTKAPALPATELAEYCYFDMFRCCMSLTKAPALPAMELAEGCYSSMFKVCKSLTTAPDLPATKLAKSCYELMFIDCNSLTEAPALPAMELAEYCYSSMFSFCTSLTTAPVLPATDLAESCYAAMFGGCTSLNYVKALFTDEPSGSTTSNWLYDVAPNGTFVKNKDATWDVRGESGIPYGWTVETDAGTSDDPQKPNPEEPSYLTFVSTGESTISLIKIGDPDPITLEYSTNGSTWTPYTIGGAITISNGENLMFRAGETGNECFSNIDYYQFEISGEVAAKGNIMSLLDRTCARNSVPSFAFNNLFSGCTSLTSAPELPATDLAEGCYAAMFSGCTSLMKAPTLPATKLAKRCYELMFIDCNSLTEAPALPAKELAEYCYCCMFNTCLKLRTVPELPATNLVEGCYDHMFSYCMNLNYVKALFTDEPSESTTAEWLGGVSFTGTFVKSKNAAWNVRGISGIPKGWTVVTE